MTNSIQVQAQTSGPVAAGAMYASVSMDVAIATGSLVASVAAGELVSLSASGQISRPFGAAEIDWNKEPPPVQSGTYPIYTISPESASASANALPSGCVAVIPIDMTVTRMTSILLAQLTLTQDFSLRTWVSIFQNGIPVNPQPNTYPVLKVNGFALVLYVPPETPPSGTIPIPVSSGKYYLNVLNLTNEANLFSFSKTDLA